VRDDEAMGRALELASAARRRTAPNPWVGCVVVRDGLIVGEGATQPPGQAHAEIEALRAAGDAAAGATAFVTLEPCSFSGRTGPCADALVGGGIARVVVAIEDPDPRVAGTGIGRLREAGVQVDVGARAEAAEEFNANEALRRCTKCTAIHPVVDVSSKAARDADYALSRQDLAEWEGRHGRLPDGCCVAMNSGWAEHVASFAKFSGKDSFLRSASTLLAG